MECLIGIACKDFSIVAADCSNVHSILVMKTDEEKIYKFSEKIIAGVVGEAGDTSQFAEYIAKNIQLYKVRNGYELSTKSAAHFTRYNLASSLRSSAPYSVNLLIGGYDDEVGGQLFYIDYLAASLDIPFAAHGYGGIICTSILDRYYKKDLTVEEAYEVLKKCVAEIQKRLVINMSKFSVQVVDKNGIKPLEPITNLTVAAN